MKINNSKILRYLFISMLLCLQYQSSSAQMTLPLQEGDLVTTTFGYNWGGTGPFVMEIMRGSNTTGVPLNYAPASATWAASNYGRYPNWTATVLGPVFGIAIDNAKNIYVSRTSSVPQFTTAYPVTTFGRIWKIDANSGANTLFIDLPNSGPGLGNLKEYNNHIYATNFEDGKIYKINMSGVIVGTAFDPQFGEPATVLERNDDGTNGWPSFGQIPYGIAINATDPSAVVKLYYGRWSRLNATPYTNSMGANLDNEIWSVRLNGAGDIIAGSENLEVNTANLSCNNPVSDIAFTNNGKRMLVGCRTMVGITTVQAHGSNSREFYHNGTTWVPVPIAISSFSGTTGNCAGGVSYSNVKIGSDSIFCDTTAWFTSDAIRTGSSTDWYGVIGYKAYTVTSTNIGPDVILDLDLDFSFQPKRWLGDVEAYRTVRNCTGCGCGVWTNVTYNQQAITNNAVYNIAQGNFNSAINAVYNCSDVSCTAVIDWAIIKKSTNTTINSGNGAVVSMSILNNLPCDSFKLVLNASCNGQKCDPFIIHFNVVCNPPSCCPEKNTLSVELVSETLTTQTGNNAVSNLLQNFRLTSSVPLTEVRVMVDEFQLTAAPTVDCIGCNNRPKTWGSLLNGTLAGSPMQTAANSASLIVDNRELLLNTGSPILLSNSLLTINIGLPPVSTIECCILKAHICLKIITKDINCRECVYYVCYDKELKKPQKGIANNTPNSRINVQKANY